jgi:hypothetical protein
MKTSPDNIAAPNQQKRGFILPATDTALAHHKPYVPAIKTAADLKRHVESAGHDSHFFTRSTMKFFGDTMSNYGVRQPREIETNMGERIQAYELVRRRAVKHRLQDSAWFHADTFARVFPKND